MMVVYNLGKPDGKCQPQIEYLDLDDEALLAHCDLDTYRASGPGGQKRNKTDSAVRLRLKDIGLIVVATESRSQHENRARALKRMRHAIALQVRRETDPDSYEPSEMLRSCLAGGARLSVGRRDERYPRVIAEVLDVLTACELRLSDAAKLLGVTTSNLSGFMRRNPKLLGRVNELRREAGHKPIRS